MGELRGELARAMDSLEPGKSAWIEAEPGRESAFARNVGALAAKHAIRWQGRRYSRALFWAVPRGDATGGMVPLVRVTREE